VASKRVTPQKARSEPPRTAARARSPPPDERLDAFRAHFDTTVAFTDALREAHCRRTDNFTARITETVDAFRPLFAPWNAEIVFSLYMNGAQRFNALKRALGGISSRVLTDKLRHLEAERLLAREEREEAAVYALTPHGERVARLLHPLVFYLRNEERL
jgi:DNA-binding HxlR family transcriptional regulator